MNDNIYNIIFNNKKVVHLNNIIANKPLHDIKCPVGLVVDEPPAGDASKLLSGIMTACQLQETDWQILPEGTDFKTIVSSNSLKYILLFNYPEKKLNLNIQLPYYYPLKFRAITLIKAHSLKEINQNKQFKKALWKNALAPLFTK